MSHDSGPHEAAGVGHGLLRAHCSRRHTPIRRDERIELLAGEFVTNFTSPTAQARVGAVDPPQYAVSQCGGDR